MRAIQLDPTNSNLSHAVQTILAQDIVTVSDTGRVKLAKGHIIEPADIPALRAYGGSLHLIEMEAGDVHEDEAARRLAQAIAGPGLEMKGPTESQIHLHAAYKGLAQVNADLLLTINQIPDVSVFTVYDEQPIAAGRPVAATKVTPLAVPSAAIEQVERLCAENGPVVSVLPFRSRPVGIVVRDRLTGRSREKFEAAIHLKLGWFGADLRGVHYLPDDVTAIADAMESLLADGVELILAAGVNSTDPLDLTLQALERIGACTEKRGVPAHPGSTCWLAYKDEVPIFGLALCGMFARTTVLDILLCRFFANKSLRADDLARLGYGGLFSKDMAFRFPDYGSIE
jgi:hypothetical protein